ncbi:DUF29 domain-containing protein [Roseofilum capinflatum]|uniref:DUF29 domain-containing protein n=1 Tax=Roseofilum capinflatum BLCC-M114 TaxID=3022440 RepID=A0ABT7BAK3_9CYAN|nr:DUF29 domain-containing protein [Roseofilum capinflatum]MDJ1176186.1 DUF29 domain-containing protein [Roseofilum capinflatum BLCC-M114]
MVARFLYDRDYHQWIQETVEALRNRNFDQIDWDNLIEELESMGKNDKRAVISLLTRLLEHLLKLKYWQAEKERCGNHWSAEIVNFRAQIDTRLEDSPSLRSQLPLLYDKAYPVALKSVSKLFDLPEDAELPLSQVLDEDWFPEV